MAAIGILVLSAEYSVSRADTNYVVCGMYSVS